MTDDPILTLTEAAQLLRMHPETLRRSQCPRIRNGRRITFDREIVLAWHRGHSVGTLAAVA
jgi:hypothetical protein